MMLYAYTELCSTDCEWLYDYTCWVEMQLWLGLKDCKKPQDY